MATHRVPPELEWHIDKDKSLSEYDAAYIDALIRFAGKELGKKLSSIIDAPCGYGRLDGLLRDSGYYVYGIDINRELIAEAKRAFPKNTNDYGVGDIRNFRLNRKFDVYVSWFTSFGYFDDKSNAEVLANAKAHLNRGGIMIIDVSNGEITEAYLKTNKAPIFMFERKGLVTIEKPELRYVNGAPFQIRNENIYKKKGKDIIFVKKHRLSRLRPTLGTT